MSAAGPHPPHPASSTPLASRPSNSALNSPSFNNINPFSPTGPPQIQTTSISGTPKGTGLSSPNYFGFQSTDSALQVNEDTLSTARHNWSPPTSAVRSAAAYSPAVVPVDQNPDYAAFRRQSEGSARSFSLGTLNGSGFKLHSPASASARPASNLSKNASNATPTKLKRPEPHLMAPPPRPSASSAHQEQDSVVPGGRNQKRHLSTDSVDFASSPRKALPATGDSDGDNSAIMTTEPDHHQRTSSANSKLFSGLSMTKHRAETVPLGANKDEARFITPQHLVNLLDSAAEDMLVLDLRVSTHYATSRITGALNLCIPTTLLKRPSFNVQKLAETFRHGDQRSKFDHWRNSRYIVVYDTSATQTKDAMICFTTINKFESEGYQGSLYIVKGGFNEFEKRFPTHVDKGLGNQAVGSEEAPATKTAKDLPPVIGGCPMPVTPNAANPFFGNIRQNMDLIGGVGQIPLKLPEIAAQLQIQSLPTWLRNASREQDGGAQVADRFLHIEKSEQKRMQQALSGDVSYGTPAEELVHRTIAIAGLEKGSKNRYNNIWPFEHTRVKLQDISKDGCDYVNANHITSPRTHKRYIATQGPIPATFADFWKVIWQEDVRVVVMLTAEKEGGQVKAHNYWNEQRYGPFKVNNMSEHKASLDPAKIYRHRRRVSRSSSGSDREPLMVRQDSKEAATADQPYVTVRRLTISHEGRPFERLREVIQMQYSSWPDFGAPAHPAHLLGLVEQCNMIVRSMNGTKYNDPEPEHSRPVLVHCSAGCGRTGTFCTVDSVLDMLKRQLATRSRKPKQPTPMELETSPPQEQSGSSFFPSPSVLGSLTHEPTSYLSSDSLQRKHSNDKDGEKATVDQGGLDAQPWVSRDDLDLVADTVDNYRLQRLSMVQSLRQFVLCYETVLEWIAMQAQRDPGSQAKVEP